MCCLFFQCEAVLGPVLLRRRRRRRAEDWSHVAILFAPSIQSPHSSALGRHALSPLDRTLFWRSCRQEKNLKLSNSEPGVSHMFLCWCFCFILFYFFFLGDSRAVIGVNSSVWQLFWCCEPSPFSCIPPASPPPPLSSEQHAECNLFLRSVTYMIPALPPTPQMLKHTLQTKMHEWFKEPFLQTYTYLYSHSPPFTWNKVLFVRGPFFF